MESNGLVRQINFRQSWLGGTEAAPSFRGKGGSYCSSPDRSDRRCGIAIIPNFIFRRFGRKGKCPVADRDAVSNIIIILELNHILGKIKSRRGSDRILRPTALYLLSRPLRAGDSEPGYVSLEAEFAVRSPFRSFFRAAVPSAKGGPHPGNNCARWRTECSKSPLQHEHEFPRGLRRGPRRAHCSSVQDQPSSDRQTCDLAIVAAREPAGSPHRLFHLGGPDPAT